jgi:predicted ATPase
MMDQMGLAVEEGISERAGPVYQFTHDIIQQTIHDLIPPAIRSLLHRTVGLKLLNAAANDAALHLLAVDQINMFCRGADPSPEDRTLFASVNAQAAKYAVAGSSFDQGKRCLTERAFLCQSS